MRNRMNGNGNGRHHGNGRAGQVTAVIPDDGAARDRDGTPIVVGCLVENLANESDFGRVTHVVGRVVIYRQLGNPDVAGHRRGESCTWQNDELLVVEDAPGAFDVVRPDRLTRALLGFIARVAQLKGECEQAAAPAPKHQADRLGQVGRMLDSGLDELFAMVRENVDADWFQQELLDAVEN